ncbi:cytochrome c family protein [Pseudoruegeria sp. HB172150]|uniref:c-type cytochrome n=1 Tax=Pseudoruegeria sp. HB172150 TaxID=2721164 RepID=UPI001551E8A7|nr:cytochrome c family protein [Pseudoruegeria sp. HB172150]
MFDTMTMTKIVGGFCGMFLIFLLGNWVAESLYHVGESGHGEEHHQAYTIDTGESEGGDDSEPEPEIDFSEVYAAADPAAGEKEFRACQSCHKVDGSNGTGPHLDGVVGRAIDSVPDFNYSGALEQVGDTWTPENLNHFLTDPKAAAPGTKMSFKGISDVEDRANLIAWLDSLGN